MQNELKKVTIYGLIGTLGAHGAGLYEQNPAIPSDDGSHIESENNRTTAPRMHYEVAAASSLASLGAGSMIAYPFKGNYIGADGKPHMFEVFFGNPPST